MNSLFFFCFFLGEGVAVFSVERDEFRLVIHIYLSKYIFIYITHIYLYIYKYTNIIDICICIYSLLLLRLFLCESVAVFSVERDEFRLVIHIYIFI